MAKYLDEDGLEYFWGKIKVYADDVGASIPFGAVDSTSTATNFTATVPGVTSLHNGVAVFLKNGVVTSTTNFTLNINDLGAKPVYTNLAAATRDTTIFNVAYTMLFIYDETRVTGGCWICYRGYDANTNTIGYQVRTNSTVRNVSDTARYYKLYFTSADSTMWVPASVNSTKNDTSARPVNQRPIDPFGPIVYTSSSTSYAAGANLGATTIWQQYTLSLGYSFNRTGEALAFTAEKPVYVKCAPQPDGSAIMDADEPIVQDLPSTRDGKIYIFLGIAYSATSIELQIVHPVYWHDGTGIRLWTGEIPLDVPLTLSMDFPLADNQELYDTSATAGDIAEAWATGRSVFFTFTRGAYSYRVALDSAAIGTDNYVYIESAPLRVSVSGKGDLMAYLWAKWQKGAVVQMTLEWEDDSGSAIEPATAAPLMDGTAAVGTSAKYAREDHVHPTDTSRQAVLVSGTNIKTINGKSILGSGDLTVSGLPTVTASDNGKVLMVVNGAWAAATVPSASGVSF